MKNLAFVRFFFAVALLFIFASNLPLAAEQADISVGQKIKVIGEGPDISAPVLLPADIHIIQEHCDESLSANVTLAAIIDSRGAARNIIFLKPTGSPLDRYAVRLLDYEQFKPAMQNNKAVATGVKVEMELDGCNLVQTASDGKPDNRLILTALPKQKISSWKACPDQVVLSQRISSGEEEQSSADKHIGYKSKDSTVPKLILSKHAQPTQKAIQAHIGKATSIVAIVIDTNGLPTKAHILKAAGYGLDEEAIKAVEQYRFLPATAAGRPVAVPVSIEVNFIHP